MAKAIHLARMFSVPRLGSFGSQGIGQVGGPSSLNKGKSRALRESAENGANSAFTGVSGWTVSLLQRFTKRLETSRFQLAPLAHVVADA
jgi:hypothetical protein